MPRNLVNDRLLKEKTKTIFEKAFAGQANLIIDREVSINFTEERDANGNYVSDIEIDVIVSFLYEGKKLLVLCECEESKRVNEVRSCYNNYTTKIERMLNNPKKIHIISHLDKTLQGNAWAQYDEKRVCFIYGDRVENISVCEAEGKKAGVVVWNGNALKYYEWISENLGSGTKYEFFKDFGWSKLEDAGTTDIPAIEIRQKDHKMYLGRIHPKMLLKITYVLRRASPNKRAYQRLINKDRIQSIQKFVQSDAPSSFIANSIIIVFDPDPEIQRKIQFNSSKKELTIPTNYCCAWMIDGQHRTYGFINSEFVTSEAKQFYLPVVIFRNLDEHVQTQTFIDINFNQKKIKTELLCDLTTLTCKLDNKLTWPSLLGHELNSRPKSPLRNKVKISELDYGRSINISSLVQYGLLDSLLGMRISPTGVMSYHGPLYNYAPFKTTESFAKQKEIFEKQLTLLDRFLIAVKKNTQNANPKQDPWTTTRKFALLKPTGINALFLLLSKILLKYPDAKVDFDLLLKPLADMDYSRDSVSQLGGGWKGFRALANKMISKINRGKKATRRLDKFKGRSKL
jgi:DGQHR domain-containing protein